ncbi:Hypothetical protein BRZCDTV_379 [Brazilian cedratvirus IHUMI]|uniref:Uncharacterized protein n=1 Tax=Brazilian cedratvirus IHUMI TaxID=2126980 RepID=A0A2R8FER7_9VIRU|nr:Hypothetical protein BRZCDTV_379 [Brazilian cedratvirus IHUMI]
MQDLYSDCIERGCTETEWRELAQRDYGVPTSFFNLKDVDTSPAQRYVEIATYFVLSPYSRVVVYPEQGVIEGIYESGAGFLEAIRRNSIPMVSFFFSRLTPQVREYVGQVVIDMEVTFFIQAWVEAMTLLFPNYTPGYGVRKQLAVYEKSPEQLSATELFFLLRSCSLGEEQLYREGLYRLTSGTSRNAFNKLQGREFFISVIESGNLEHVNQLLPFFTSLPDSYTLGNPLPHTASKEERNYARGYMQAACFSAEVELVDFFLAYFYPERTNLFPECVYSLLSGYSVHRKVIQVYNLLPRIELNTFQVSAFARSGNLDFITYYLSRIQGNQTLIREILQSNFGNIPVVISLSPLLSASELSTLKAPYPLTRRILEE